MIISLSATPASVNETAFKAAMQKQGITVAKFLIHKTGKASVSVRLEGDRSLVSGLFSVVPGETAKQFSVVNFEYNAKAKATGVVSAWRRSRKVEGSFTLPSMAKVMGDFMKERATKGVRGQPMGGGGELLPDSVAAVRKAIKALGVEREAAMKGFDDRLSRLTQRLTELKQGKK